MGKKAKEKKAKANQKEVKEKAVLIVKPENVSVTQPIRVVKNNDKVKIMDGANLVCEGTRTLCKARLFPEEIGRSSNLANLLKKKHPEYQIIY